MDRSVCAGETRSLGSLQNSAPRGSELMTGVVHLQPRRNRKSTCTFAHPDIVLWGSVDFHIGDGDEFLLSLA